MPAAVFMRAVPAAVLMLPVSAGLPARVFPVSYSTLLATMPRRPGPVWMASTGLTGLINESTT